MEGRGQPAQRKEMSTRPKEPRGRGRSAPNPVQSENTLASTVKKRSEKPGKHTSSQGDDRCDGLSSCRKISQKKSPGVQKSNSNPADENNDMKTSRKQSLKDTSANKEKDKGTSSGSNDKIAQLTSNVRYLPDGLHCATEKKPSRKLNTSKSLDQETNRAEDKSPAFKMIDKPQKLNSKYKSSDEICEIERQVEVASEKKVCGKTDKAEKLKISNLKNEHVAEPKERDVNVKTVNSRTRRLKDVVDEKLRLKMDHISNAAQSVNKIVDVILKSEQFRKDSLFKDIKKMSTGSYYEHVKISKPNEFDIMLMISQQPYNTIKITNLDNEGPFYTLAYKERKPQAMTEYLDSEGNISARKIVGEFRALIKQIIGKSGMEEVSLQRKDPGSPAVTLIIKNELQDISVDLVLALKIPSRWPEQTNSGMNIDNWLGTKVKREYIKNHFYMVPKQAMVGNRIINADTWRISFSEIEKRILANHGNVKTCCESGGSKREMCCRKQCLKLLKHLLELLKNNGNQRKMDQFCSYHAKTALLHHCSLCPKDEDWKLEDLESCFNRYVEFFQDCLKKYTLCNFFIPSHNLFSAQSVDKSSCDYLFKELEKQKSNNYPIFYE
ncbi:cyclic GMP-AMP synthase [Bufo gargarizans]|uniref:cyclic GMP-AMP synthase n=1 Tax=Bufo gargarizans TaxID=30331 RepID=UPI001CF4E0A6|nr:cyclic GMP-AMP synthase [Bufo gargarizans]